MNSDYPTQAFYDLLARRNAALQAAGDALERYAEMVRLQWEESVRHMPNSPLAKEHLAKAEAALADWNTAKEMT